MSIFIYPFDRYSSPSLAEAKAVDARAKRAAMLASLLFQKSASFLLA
jgi:hypothetical protein